MARVARKTLSRFRNVADTKLSVVYSNPADRKKALNCINNSATVQVQQNYSPWVFAFKKYQCKNFTFNRCFFLIYVYIPGGIWMIVRWTVNTSFSEIKHDTKVGKSTAIPVKRDPERIADRTYLHICIITSRIWLI